MKIICKKRIANQNLYEAVKCNVKFGIPNVKMKILVEEEILTKAHHESIPKLEFTFENDKKMFLVQDYTETSKPFDL